MSSHLDFSNDRRPPKESGPTITRHADCRMRQRGLRERDLVLVRECGTPGPYGRIVLRDRDVDRAIRECKKMIQSLERLRGCVVVCEDERLVTCYHAAGKAGRRAFRRRRGRDPWRRRPRRRRPDLGRRREETGRDARLGESIASVAESAEGSHQ